MTPKFSYGKSVEVQVAGEWKPGVVNFVWRGVDLETRRKIFQYDVVLEGSGPSVYVAAKVSESEVRRVNRARGRRRVLRAHSLKPGLLT